jgi:uncharacterized protein DUF87
MATGVTTDSVDYLQRCVPLAPDPQVTQTAGAPEGRRLLRVRGVGRPERPSNLAPRVPHEPWLPRTAELVTGLYGSRTPLALLLRGAADGVQVHLGTWSSGSGRAAVQDRRRDVLGAVLGGLYSEVDVEEVTCGPLDWTAGGLALGVPAPLGLQEDGAAPVDRIVASLAGTAWEVLVLAHPVPEEAVASVRQQVLNELRAVAAETQSEGAPSPLAEHYVELLKVLLSSLGQGMATGAWRTSAYLLGTAESYPRLAAAWRSVFSGARSLPEPVRVFDLPAAELLAAGWAMPDQPGGAAPGHYRRPFEMQTLLTTPQLAAYVHLPELETPGFAVAAVASFDSVRAGPSGDGDLPVGRIVHRGRETAGDYRVPLPSLTRHTFVAGVTGSGKTNTVFGMLAEAHDRGIPFLVVEPAKKEYRSLLDHPRIGAGLQVFTAGQATVSPLMLNPFEVPEGIEVSTHIDLLRAVFGTAFSMWGPLPQILERCLHEVYVDRGWDLVSNTNSRVTTGDRRDAFPTLADLVDKVGEVVPLLGYETPGDLSGALVTRIDSLRKGGKGAMLDVSRSLPWDDLLSRPTVVELEAMGDEGDKAFVAGLLLIRLAEHRRAQGPAPGLVHLLVIEEAHRLLAHVPSVVSEETANPRGQAVETFSNLVSEVRAYGQGIVIADQVPVRLAPDVMKNSNLKIAHRVVSLDDRTALAGAMAMDEVRARALTSLAPGRALVFGSGDNAPLMVQVPLVKDALADTVPDDGRLRAHMGEWRGREDRAELFLPRPFCAVTCRGAAQACEAGRRLAGDPHVQPTLARVLLSSCEDPGALDRLWGELLTVVRAHQPPGIDEADLLRAFAGHGADWYAGRRGAQAGWSYEDTGELAGCLRAVLLHKVGGGDEAVAASDPRARLTAVADRLHTRRFEPYPACAVVCSQSPRTCRYRAAVADLVATGRYQTAWQEAASLDQESDDGPEATWSVIQDAAYELIEFPGSGEPPEVQDRMQDAYRRVALCFEQQMLAADPDRVPRAARRVLEDVLAEAALPNDLGSR